MSRWCESDVPEEDYGEKCGEKCGESVEKVWRLMKQDPYITTKQIADAVGLSIRGIEENIKKLKREGRIRRIGGDKGGHWKVIE